MGLVSTFWRVLRRSMWRRKHSRKTSLMSVLFYPRRMSLPLMMLFTMVLLPVPTPLAFPLAAVAVTPADSGGAVATASSWGVPFSDTTTGTSTFCHRRSIQQQQRQQQQQQQRAHRSMLKPRHPRVSMALPNRYTSLRHATIS